MPEKPSAPARLWRRLRSAVGGVAGLFVGGCASAEDAKKFHPKCVLIIRHAEKPPDEAKSPDLNDLGKKRAAALPGLFQKAAGRPDPLPVPDVVFAARDSAKSRRPSQTVAPLAAELRLKINAEFEDDEETTKLAKELLTRKYAGKTVLVSWRHTNIPVLAKALGAGGPLTWDDHVYDRVWKVTYDAQGIATLADLPQRLLPGDAGE